MDTADMAHMADSADMADSGKRYISPFSARAHQR